MSSVKEMLRQCEEALSEQAEALGTQSDAAVTKPTVAALANLKLVTEALSTIAPIPTLSERIVSDCTCLLEKSGVEDTLLLRILTQFLADMSLNENNGALFLHFGIPSCYLLVLQEWPKLTPGTLCSVFDFLATISTNSALGRCTLRPCIPYILSSMEHNLYAMDILFGGAVALSTLATLDKENCDLIAQRGGVQTLVGAFYHACRMAATVQGVERAKTMQSSSALLARTQAWKLEEQAQLCHDVQKWCRDVLLKVGRTRSEAFRAALQRTDFGVYGRCLSVDELKWALTLEQE